MSERTIEKPKKKTDKELYRLLVEKIHKGDYVFTGHAQDRRETRHINDLDILSILEGKTGWKRKRNPSKDKFVEGKQDWNYRLEGVNLDKDRIGIIISFSDELLLIITVMWINKHGEYYENKDS